MIRRAVFLMTPDEFEAAMPYFVTRHGKNNKGDSRLVAYDFHVLGLPRHEIANKHQLSSQHVGRVLTRFANAYDLMTTARANAKKGPRLAAKLAVPIASSATHEPEPASAPVVAKTVSAKKVAAPSAPPASATKAPAKKNPAKTAPTKPAAKKSPARKRA